MLNVHYHEKKLRNSSYSRWLVAGLMGYRGLDPLSQI